MLQGLQDALFGRRLLSEAGRMQRPSLALAFLFYLALVITCYIMSSKYQFNDNSHLYFVSFAVVNWIDVLQEKNTKVYLLKVFNIAS